ALTEMQVAAGEQRARHVNWIEHARTAGEILDVVVPAVLPGGDGARAVAPDRSQRVTGCRAAQCVFLQRWQRKRRNSVRGGGDQRPLAGVPAPEQLRRRRSAEQSWVRDAGELDTGKVPRGALLTGEIPDRLVRVGETVGEEAAAVGLGADPCVPPALAG